MASEKSAALKNRVRLGLQELGVQNILFRNAIARRLGINVADMECLGYLFNRRQASPTELAQHTGLSSGATTAMLDRLERAGLIERRPNPADRRGTLIHFRPVRPEIVVSWFASSGKAQAKLLDGYSDRDLAVIADFFEKSVEMWEQERSKLTGKSN